MPGREFETVQTLRGEILALLERVQELDGKLRTYGAQHPPPGELPEPALITCAYLLSLISRCFEDLFLKVARVFEERVENLAAVPGEVLERMLIEIAGVRPRVIGRTAFRLLSELRVFRHVFHSSYLFELDSEKVRFMLRRWEAGKGGVRKDLQSFLDGLTLSAAGDS
ncbi:MAG: hypothetical protein K6T86_21170 [Pirellulales bacterium]|nr:hypothetical protein [Pirellulales bacterium]